MKKLGRAALSLLLAALLCLSLLPMSAGAVGDAMSLDAVKALLNAEPLHPQKTGYVELDAMLEELAAPYQGQDTYTTLKGLYDWTVNNIDYSWDGYSQDYAPAYDCFTLTYDLTYETGLPQAYPVDMIYRAYHMLTARTGVCYDWGILFAVMARYIGIESYVHTGILRIGSWTGHHGWTELRLGGKNYIFDGQQDWRSKGIYGYIVYDHFGIPMENAWRYQQETAANGPRDASMLPVDAPRVRVANVNVTPSRSGQVQGGGAQPWGQEVTLASAGDLPVVGWYTPSGTLLSQESSYTFLLEGDTTVCALFEGDGFIDVPAGAWYLDDLAQAVEQGLFSGTSQAFFEPQSTMNRAMFATVLYQAEGAPAPEEDGQGTPFTDVASQDWFSDAVAWAYQAGVIHGMSDTEFAPWQAVTREQAATMMVQFLERYDVTVEAEKPSFADAEQISAYAVETVAQAQALGLLEGYEDGTVQPQKTLTRAEAAAMLVNMAACLDAAA